MDARRDPRRVEMPGCDDRLVWDVWLSRLHFPALTVADEIGLFAHLDAHPATADDVAEGLGLGRRGARALLGLLAALGFLAQHQGRFYLSDVARTYLLPDSPYYWGGMLQLFKDRPLTHDAVREALQREAQLGAETFARSWETGELDEAQARAITRAMHSHSFPAAVGLARRGDFSGVRRLLDVGGGSGGACIAIALRYPEMRCTVLELPAVCRIAQQYVAEYGLAEQIDTVAADMFADPWPAGYDAVLFGNVFHDWDRTRCLALSRRSFEALPAGGRIYLHEMLLADTKDSPLAAAAFSMQMAVRTRGKQFTAGELVDLLSECGFVDAGVTPTYGYYSLVSARKP
ncbi:MAG: methyltransferase [Chloroflexota bacterium]